MNNRFIAILVISLTLLPVYGFAACIGYSGPGGPCYTGPGGGRTPVPVVGRTPVPVAVRTPVPVAVRILVLAVVHTLALGVAPTRVQEGLAILVLEARPMINGTAPLLTANESLGRRLEGGVVLSLMMQIPPRSEG